MTDFQAAAQRYFDDHGWVCIPLVLDDNGKPKRPFSNGWQQTPAEWPVIAALPWERAKGIGIVLGEVSDNLAVIDIDSVELSEALLGWLSANATKPYYAVRTGSNRSHLYFREGAASAPVTFREAKWRGESFSVELKGRGQQVAAPPTPGYSLVGTTSEPMPIALVGEAWDAIAHGMAVEGADSKGRSGGKGSSHGYPSPWADRILEGSRNNAVYVEACRLAEAKMPLDSAIATMLARLSVAAEGRIDERSMVATIRSAYRKVNKPLKGWIHV